MIGGGGGGDDDDNDDGGDDDDASAAAIRLFARILPYGGLSGTAESTIRIYSNVSHDISCALDTVGGQRALGADKALRARGQWKRKRARARQADGPRKNGGLLSRGPGPASPTWSAGKRRFSGFGRGKFTIFPDGRAIRR